MIRLSEVGEGRGEERRGLLGWWGSYVWGWAGLRVGCVDEDEDENEDGQRFLFRVFEYHMHWEMCFPEVICASSLTAVFDCFLVIVLLALSLD